MPSQNSHVTFHSGNCNTRNITAIYCTLQTYYIYVEVHLELELSTQLVNCSYHIEILFVPIIMLACQNFRKASYTIFNSYIFTRSAGKALSYRHWLCQKSLDFPRARHY